MKLKLIVPIFATMVACANGEDTTPAADTGVTRDASRRYDTATVTFDSWKPRDQTVTDQAPLVDTLVMDGPVVDGPVVDGPVVDGPVVDGPVVDGPVVDGPVVDGPVVDGPVVDGPVVDSGDDASQELSCSEFITCGQACGDWDCLVACQDRVCTSGTGVATALVSCGLSKPETDAGSAYTCLGTSGPCANGFDATCQTCLDDNCGPQLANCRAHTSCN
jgi:hypothetical protein